MRLVRGRIRMLNFCVKIMHAFRGIFHVADPKQDEGFKVVDRRLFTEDGELRKDAADQDRRWEEESSKKAAATSAPKAQPKPSGDAHACGGNHGRRTRRGSRGGRGESAVSRSFQMLVDFLTRNAAAMLGGMADPRTGQAFLDLEGAREVIDMLDALREKTRGNLAKVDDGSFDGSAGKPEAHLHGNFQGGRRADAEKSGREEIANGIQSRPFLSIHGFTSIDSPGIGHIDGRANARVPLRRLRVTDPLDKRMRPSVLLSYAGRNVVIDTSPDFRSQAMREHMDRLDAVIYTHGHADHILGLDDIRPFNMKQQGVVPIYAAADTRRPCSGSSPTSSTTRQTATCFRASSCTRSTDRSSFWLDHHARGGDAWPAACARISFRKCAYLTDFISVPEESKELLRGLDDFILDALRYVPHPMHSNVEQSLALVAELQPKRAWFTHICHDLATRKPTRGCRRMCGSPMTGCGSRCKSSGAREAQSQRKNGCASLERIANLGGDHREFRRHPPGTSGNSPQGNQEARERINSRRC